MQYVPSAVFQSDIIRFRKNPETYGGFAYTSQYQHFNHIPVGHWSHLNSMVFVESREDIQFTTELASPLQEPALLKTQLTTYRMLPTIRRSIKILYESILGQQKLQDTRKRVTNLHMETKKVRERNINRFTTIAEDFIPVKRKLSFRGRGMLEKQQGWGGVESLADIEGSPHIYDSMKTERDNTPSLSDNLLLRKARKPLTRSSRVPTKKHNLPELPRNEIDE